VSAPSLLISNRVSGAVAPNYSGKELRKRYKNPIPKGRKDGCPRGGYIVLQDIKSTVPTVAPTSCKTWGCLSCRPKVLKRVQDIAMFGMKKCSSEGKFYFITLTFVLGSKGIRNADFVNRVWRRWLERIRRTEPMMWRKMKWFKVIELTKKGQPHLHLLMSFGGSEPKKTICDDRYEFKEEWMERECGKKEVCLKHVIGKAWAHANSGDSWVVHVGDKVTPERGVAYVTKYLTKEMWGIRLARLGFGRRWSRSQSWPRVERLQLRGTQEGRWINVQIVSAAETRETKERYKKIAEASAVDRLSEVVGEPMVIELYEKQRNFAIRKKMEALGASYA
jgi:hypothetical protein